MELEFEIFKWMISHYVLTTDNGRPCGVNRMKIEDNISTQFVKGPKMAQLVYNIQHHLTGKSTQSGTLEGINENAKIPREKLENWKVITKALQDLGIELGGDTVSVILANDYESIADLLLSIHRKTKHIISEGGVGSGNPEEPHPLEHLSHPTPPTNPPPRITSPRIPREERVIEQELKRKSTQELDITSIDPRRPLKETETTLEFMICSICNKFTLNPNQAIGLLANNSKYLAHVIRKGLKENYRIVLEWYQTTFTQLPHLLELAEGEEGNNSLSFILNTFKLGFFSLNSDVVNFTCRLMGRLAQMLQQKRMSGSAWEWFIGSTPPSGLMSALFALRSNYHLGASLTSVLCTFGSFNYMELFTHYMKKEVGGDPEAYMECALALCSPISEFKLYREELILSGVLNFWIDFASKFAESAQDTYAETNPFRLRATAISLLVGVWQYFPHAVQDSQHAPNYILKVLKRSVRLKYQPLQITALTHLFKLLDIFANERNAYAPIIYKTLTFALIENHQDYSIRQYMMKNFLHVFDTIRTIPCAILLDPLFKQIKVSHNITYYFNTFDLEFLKRVTRHPKLQIKNAAQLLDLMGKIYLTDLLNATAAGECFVNVATRFQKDSLLPNFLAKFAQICIQALTQNLEFRLKRHRKVGGRHKNYTNIMKGTGSEGEVEDKLRQAHDYLIIQLIEKLLHIDNLGIHQALRAPLVSGYQNLSTVGGREHTGVREILDIFYDGVERAINDHNEEMRLQQNKLLESLDISKNSGVARKGSYPIPNPPMSDYSITATPQKQVSAKGSGAKRYNMQNKSTKNLGNAQSVAFGGRYDDSIDFGQIDDERSAISEKDLVTKTKAKNGPKVAYPAHYHMLPYKQLSLMEQKALLEIEKIKRKKEERIEKKRIEEERKRIDGIKKKKVLKRQLERRKLELGVATRNIADMDENLLLEEGMVVRNKRKEFKLGLPEIHLVELEYEEEKDQEGIKLLIQKYRKLFRYLFNKYSNSAYSVKKRGTFGDSKSYYETINLAELIRLLNDHDIRHTMVTNSQLTTLLRLIKADYKKQEKEEGPMTQLTTITYSQFLDFLTQLSFYLIPRSPFNLKSASPLQCFTAFLNHIRRVGMMTGKNVALYENLEASSLGDPEVIEELEQRLMQNPHYPLPEGYKRIVQKEVIEEYEIPNTLGIRESTKVSCEVLDNLLNNIFGIHFIEPISVTLHQPKVIPTIGHLPKPPVKQQGYMTPINRQIKRITPLPKLTYKNSTSEVRPTLKRSMKLEVAKYPFGDRGLVHEVAEVLEEIISSVEQGRINLPSRSKYGPNIEKNRIMREKRYKQDEEKKSNIMLEERRKLRTQIVKKKLNKQKEQYELKRKEEDDKRKSERLKKNRQLERSKKQREYEKIRIDEERKKHNDEKYLKEEEVKNLREEEKLKTIAKNRQVQKKQKARLKADIQTITQDRKEKEEKKIATDKKKEKKEGVYRKKVIEKIEEDKEKRKVFDEEKQKLREFISSPGVVNVFKKYRIETKAIFKFYCKLPDSEVESIDVSGTSLHFRNYIKFCQHFKVSTVLHSTQIVYAFKHLLKERYGEKDQEKDQKLMDNRHELFDFKDFEECIVRLAILGKNKKGSGDLAFNFSGVFPMTIESFLRQTVGLKGAENTQELDKKFAICKASNTKINAGLKGGQKKLWFKKATLKEDLASELIQLMDKEEQIKKLEQELPPIEEEKKQ